MRESFVFHSEFLEDLPEEYQDRFLKYVYQYGIYGIIPELTGLEETVWLKIQRRIDIDQSEYDAKIKQRADAGKKHSGNQYSAKKTESSDKPKMERNGTKWNEMERNGTKWNDLERDGTNGTVIDIVIDNDIVNDIDTDTVTVCDSKVCVSNTGEFQETIFQEISDHNSNSKNKIPCSKNFSSFVQKECREILDYRGDSTLDDLTKAFQNYLLVAKMDTWKKSFTIRDFTRNVTEYLPEFFNPDKFKTSKTKQKQKQSASDIDAQIERLFSD